MVEIENFLNITLPDKVLESNMLMDIPRLVEIISACSNHGQIHLEILNDDIITEFLLMMRK